MKKILFFCFFILLISGAFATHIIGGEMRYEYIGLGTTLNTKQYRIRLLLLRDGASGAQFIPQYIVGVFDNDNGLKVPGTAANNNWAAVEDFSGALPVPIIISPCISNVPFLDYTYKRYTFVIELPNNNTGYTVAFQTYSRQNSNNVQPNQGATYSCVIPGLNVLPNPLIDNSPEHKLPISVICENSPFILDFSAIDPEGDSLVYAFCDAYNGGEATLADFQNPAPPPYVSVSYINPYISSRPMGNLVSINPSTGIISGTAPGAGKYVVCVCTSVYRNGVLISVHRKDLIVAVSGCIPLSANPNFIPITCDGFNVNFTDNSTGNPSTFLWNFGDPASGTADTSTLQNPSHTFTDTGVFNIKLVVSIVGQCIDSIIKPLKVYPGFLPGFLSSAPLCAGQPVQFTDTTYSRYGAVNSWRWDFGDIPPGSPGDTSIFQNPVYTYNTPGTYNVELIVTNDKGCLKIYNKDVIINDVPLLSLFPGDTTYCGLDSLQLTAGGTGTFSWAPLTNITGGNTATPIVFPTIATRYKVTLTNAAGCSSKDSLLVTPKLDLANSILATPATICEEDTLLLTGNSNYSGNVTWQWSPAATVAFPAQQITSAWPLVNTTYTLITRWGAHCVATANKDIIVRPLAIPYAGPDTTLCNEQTSIQLNAGGGNTYQWTPTTGLSNPNIANPMASPITTTTYTVAVGVTGCSKTRVDSMVLTVRTLPVITLTNDTLICAIDTLQISSTGTGNFNWTPNYNISSTTVANPMVSPDVPTTYHVRLTDPFGCFRDDSVFVDVKAFVTLNAGPDTTICQTDGFLLNATGDALHYIWTPPAYLNLDNIKQPFATPLNTITYHVIGNIGKCQSEDDVTIKVVPYPPANAGPDSSVCFGFSAQLNASGGSNYAWSPATFLNDRFLPNPHCLNPTANIQYIVTVRDTLGCPKPMKDTVWVKVYPGVIANAGRDTSVVEGEPLFLQATGGNTYLWDPALWLNNPNIAAPVSLPHGNIQYVVTVTSIVGCVATDTIDIKLYKVDPDMYVPTAFTPNGDGNNDVLRPILLGMKDLTYFRVYDRWGVLMFSTTEKGKGWDGRYGGKAQDPATFVWMAEGITYKREIKFKKGYAVLIR